ncbi:hypothetical protein MNBD_GAMMA13-2160 [hydrothermal vent metagenome]|uniref:Uncharacterized protein n=1 Tax=hydrothermal vent metagenome TaxID=652676 RepID=A0A3B0YM29_9ZZZZ
MRQWSTLAAPVFLGAFVQGNDFRLLFVRVIGTLLHHLSTFGEKVATSVGGFYILFGASVAAGPCSTGGARGGSYKSTNILHDKDKKYVC